MMMMMAVRTAQGLCPVEAQLYVANRHWTVLQTLTVAGANCIFDMDRLKSALP